MIGGRLLPSGFNYYQTTYEITQLHDTFTHDFTLAKICVDVQSSFEMLRHARALGSSCVRPCRWPV